MKTFLVISSFIILVAACAGDGEKENNQSTETTTETSTAKENPSYDSSRGEGSFHDVKLSDKLDAAKAAKGEKISDLKCMSCHKLTGEKLVGPGWKDVTVRHKPEWVLNFITNPDPMIDKDPKAQAMLELCMVRMPNQNLSEEDALAIYEFMRKNDGVK